LASIQANISEDSFPSTVGSVWKQLRAEGTPLAGVSFQSLSDQGQLLDGSAFENLPFREGESLHFEPKREMAVAE